MTRTVDLDGLPEPKGERYPLPCGPGWVIGSLSRSEMYEDAGAEDGETGLVEEDGLVVYRTGRPLPDHILDQALLRMREERASHILGGSL